jgi:capsular exopolysaccharide synthesis family protein
MESSSLFFIIHSKNTLVNELSRKVQVDPLNLNANTIRVSFKDNNALKAFDIVNKIDSLYILYSNEQKNLANKQKIEWLNRELTIVEKRMEDFENYFETFTLQNKSNDLGADMKRIITSINKIDSQRYSINKKLIELNSVMDGIISSLSTKAFDTYSFLPENFNQQLKIFREITHERDRLALSHNENTFAYRQKENELNELKDELFSSLKNLKQNWMNSLAELSNQKSRLEQQFNSMPDKNTKFLKNQRFYNLFTEFYLTMMQSKSEFEIAQAGSVPDFKILSSASMPGEPVSPKRILIYGIGFSIGLFAALFALGVMYVLNNKITSLKEVEDALDMPILGVIPASRQPKISPFHVIDNPQSMLSESMRTLRTNLDFFTSASGKKVITITSTVSGEGKSFIALNLSAILANSNKKVVIIDLDMRKPKKVLPSTVEIMDKGLSTILIGKHKWQECVQPTEIEFLDFIPSGPQPPNPSELLLNESFINLIDELKEKYDFVLMDTPPVGLVTDAVLAIRKSDLSIYVVRANYSKSEFLDNVERVKTMNKISNMALVVNSLNQHGKSYGYGYYYERPIKKAWSDILKS